MSVVCPECDNPLDIDTDEVEAGETLTCDECGTELEIVSSDPLEISPIRDEDEEDDDEDDYDEDEEDDDDYDDDDDDE